MIAQPRSFQRLLTLSAALAYGIWYSADLALCTTNWFPKNMLDELSGWGDCLFLSLAGLLSFLCIQRDHGCRRAMAGSLLILGGAGAAELVGVRTGYPFGAFRYTDHLGWRLLGWMPWIIPVFWLVVMANAYAVCSVMIAGLSDYTQGFLPRQSLWRSAGGRDGSPTRAKSTQPGRDCAYSSDRQLLLILLTSLTVTFVDLNLEPAAVNVRQYWIWLERDPAYYGVPSLNFFGWFFVSMVLVSLLSHLLDPRQWRLSTAWRCLAILASIQFFFMLLNWKARQYAPVLIALNLTGVLAIGLVAFGGKSPDPKESGGTDLR